MYFKCSAVCPSSYLYFQITVSAVIEKIGGILSVKSALKSDLCICAVRFFGDFAVIHYCKIAAVTGHFHIFQNFFGSCPVFGDIYAFKAVVKFIGFKQLICCLYSMKPSSVINSVFRFRFRRYKELNSVRLIPCDVSDAPSTINY